MIKKNFLILLLIFTASCGYQSIYLDIENSDFNIVQSELIGDDIINKVIRERLLERKEKNIVEKNYSIKIISDSTKEIKSKDGKGKADLFKMIVEVKLIVESEETGENYEKVFLGDSTYRNSSNKFSLSEYEKIIKGNIATRIVNIIKNYLNFL